MVAPRAFAAAASVSQGSEAAARRAYLALWAATAPAASASTAPQLRVLLALPTVGGCGTIQGLAVSPDSAWLAFVDIHDPTQEVYALALPKLLPQVPPPPAPQLVPRRSRCQWSS